MQTFFFDTKDGVPLRDRIGVEFDTNVEAIEHSRVLAQHFRDESLRDDQDLEISVVNRSPAPNAPLSATLVGGAEQRGIAAKRLRVPPFSAAS
jgi:hypothetical protein